MIQGLLLILSLMAGDYTDPASWRGIRKGITPDQANRFLGDPPSIDKKNISQVWIYQGEYTGALPARGYLIFKLDKSGWHLTAFELPDFSLYPPPVDEAAERAREARETMARQQALAEQRRIETEQRRAERLEQRRLQAEQRRRELAERVANPVSESRSESVEQSPPKSGFASKYFISIGAAMFIMAALISITYGARPHG